MTNAIARKFNLRVDLIYVYKRLEELKTQRRF